MNGKVRFFLHVAGTLVLAAGLRAQEAPAGSAAQTSPPAQAWGTTRPAPSATNLLPGGQVRLDVVVTAGKRERDRQPVGGLQEKDFTVLDNGQPQKLVGFREVDTAAKPDAVQVLIVVDMINASLDRVAYMRQQLGEFLTQNGGNLAHPTTIAVMSERGARLVQGTSRDGNALNANFQRVPTDLRVIGRSAGFYGATERIDMSLTEMRQIINYEAQQPGRKLVVMVSPGWYLLPMAGAEEDMDQRDWVFNMITRVTTELQAGHVTLYCVDPEDLGQRDPFFYQAFLKPVKRPYQAEYPTLALQVFAEHSGGRAVIMGRADIKGELDAAMRDAGPYYELTFVPRPADNPNEYHDLKVNVDRPAMTVQTDAGYYANVQPVGKNTQKPRKAVKRH